MADHPPNLSEPEASHLTELGLISLLTDGTQATDNLK
jgi:hypothetical protein